MFMVSMMMASLSFILMIGIEVDRECSTRSYIHKAQDGQDPNEMSHFTFHVVYSVLPKIILFGSHIQREIAN